MVEINHVFAYPQVPNSPVARLLSDVDQVPIWVEAEITERRLVGSQIKHAFLFHQVKKASVGVLRNRNELIVSNKLNLVYSLFVNSECDVFLFFLQCVTGKNPDRPIVIAHQNLPGSSLTLIEIVYYAVSLGFYLVLFGF